jgi:hypothetical protein
VETLYGTIADVGGATYRYIEDRRGLPDPAPAEPTSDEIREHFAALPKEVAAKIRRATIDADFDRVITLVDQIPDLDAAIAGSLRAMAEQYEAARIISILTPEN